MFLDTVSPTANGSVCLLLLRCSRCLDVLEDLGTILQFTGNFTSNLGKVLPPFSQRQSRGCVSIFHVLGGCSTMGFTNNMPAGKKTLPSIQLRYFHASRITGITSKHKS